MNVWWPLIEKTQTIHVIRNIVELTSSTRRRWFSLLWRGGRPLVVGVHAEAAAAPHHWTLQRSRRQERRGVREGGDHAWLWRGQQARPKGSAGRRCTPLSPFDGFFTFNPWWPLPANSSSHQQRRQQPNSQYLRHVRSWIAGFRQRGGPPTPILSSISWRAFSNCCGVPRMEKMRTLGSVLGGGFLCSSTWARDCSLMFLMVSPPRSGTSEAHRFDSEWSRHRRQPSVWARLKNSSIEARLG